MKCTTSDWTKRSRVVVTAVLTLACGSDGALAPGDQTALAAPTAPTTPAATNDDRAADLGSCTDLAAPAGSKLVFHVYATGVQIYRWNGTAWAFVAPDATLSADAGGRSKVGIHYAGPTWESNSGSKVVGTADKRCTPNAAAIPWLTLNVVSATGPGIFDRVTFIQRLETTGGLAPSSPGTAVGDVARVPYTAEYFFYR